MIFLLVNTVNGEIRDLSEQKEYTVGRKNCDILLENDPSISRQHAVLKVKKDYVILEDCGSKYHTLHNSNKIDPKIQIRLKHMDLIQFGMYHNKFCFESHKFIVAASALSADKKSLLKQSLASCNGKYVDKWSNICTHLTVDKLTLTIKVLQALVDEKPIVTVDYWIDYARSLERKSSPPNVDKYKPLIGEQLLRSDFEYKIDSRRKTLFNNKLFIFLKEITKKQIQGVIKSCGGDSISWEEKPQTLFDINKSPVEHLLVKADNDEENVSFDAIIKELGKQKKRPIPMNEIALAIVNCSCEINCNPNFNKVSEVFGGGLKKQRARDVLAIETQSENFLAITPGIKTENVIPSTVEDDWMRATGVKENHAQTAEASGLKRVGTEQPVEIAAKKFKSEVEEGSGKKIEKIQPKIPAMFVGIHKNKTKNTESDSFKSTQNTSQKRKATADEVETKNSNLKLNPFSSINKLSLNKRAKSNEEANPFELIRSSKPSKFSSKAKENPFDNIMSMHRQPTCTVKEENIKPIDVSTRVIKLAPLKETNSAISPSKKSFLNITWTSKSNIKYDTVTVKEEDPDMAKISEAFRNCVKVEILSIYERPSSIIHNVTVESLDGKKNYKKFRKVKPLKPQVTIIGRHQFKKVAPGDVSAISVNDHDSEDEGGIPDFRNKTTVKPVGKRFVL